MTKEKQGSTVIWNLWKALTFSTEPGTQSSDLVLTLIKGLNCAEKLSPCRRQQDLDQT